MVSRYAVRKGVDMRTIANLLWFVLGGFAMGLGWWLAGLIMLISIVGIPWARACFVLGTFCFFPFGREAIDRRELTGRGDLGTGTLGLLGNILWFVVAGIWLAIGHIGSAIVNFASIIGIPFGIQHLKLAGCALAPVGKTIVDKEVAAEARRRNAMLHLHRLR
jgi:uncharacterized membrane protein YccF (DUF307 family)